jgi:hypothetical protein
MDEAMKVRTPEDVVTLKPLRGVAIHKNTLAVFMDSSPYLEVVFIGAAKLLLAIHTPIHRVVRLEAHDLAVVEG